MTSLVGDWLVGMIALNQEAGSYMSGLFSLDQVFP